MTERYDLIEFIAYLDPWLDAHYLGRPGAYARYTKRPGEWHPDPYGSADAANIRYTIGRFPRASEERQQWVEQLRRFQSAEDGAFRDATHSNYHTTAHCVAALELFDAGPRHPLWFLHPLLERDALEAFLDSLNWDDNAWRASHDGAGSAAALALTGDAEPEWMDWYFDWLDTQVDPGTGLWRRGSLQPITQWPGLFGNLAGTFHYHFLYTHYRRPIPYPERVIDTCLRILEADSVALAVDSVGFAEIDWIFCVNRAWRESGHRRDDVRDAMHLMAGRVVELLSDPRYLEGEKFDDVHTAFGAVCALAELQQALPGTIRTPQPLKLVLDRRPFI